MGLRSIPGTYPKMSQVNGFWGFLQFYCKHLYDIVDHVDRLKSFTIINRQSNVVLEFAEAAAIKRLKKDLFI